MEDLNNNVPESEVQVEAQVEASAPVQEKAEETTPAYVAPTEEEYKRTLQSERSKAKNELLKELGITSVDDYKQKVSKYDEAISNRETLEQELETSKSNNSKLEKELVLSRLNVNDESKNDFITLVESNKGDKSFEETAKEILERYPNFKKQTIASIKVGTEKAEVKNDTKKISDALTAQYPWLAN